MHPPEVGYDVDGGGRVALVTGSAGFKGQWLTRLLTVTGFEPLGWDKRWIDGQPGQFVQVDLLESFVIPESVDVVFHLAAQSLVPVGYEDPVSTWATNVQATVNLLEACRRRRDRLDVIVVTSDKVYTLPSERRPLREDDELGGYCPYSCSKAAAELVVRSYRTLLPDCVRVVTVRAGNVIGGGDEAPARLVPDVIRAARMGRGVELRRPESTRPWLFVLDCLWGYVLVSQALHAGLEIGHAVNFGPDASTQLSAGELAEALAARLGAPAPEFATAPAFDEAPYIELDSTHARLTLGWEPLIAIGQALEWTAEWALASPETAEEVRADQIDRFVALATRGGRAP